MHIHGDCCAKRAQPSSSCETSRRGCGREEIISCIWAFGQGTTHLYYTLFNSSLAIQITIASPLFKKDLKKLLDDNNREVKAQGGNGGGLPQDLVRFLPELHQLYLSSRWSLICDNSWKVSAIATRTGCCTGQIEGSWLVCILLMFVDRAPENNCNSLI